MFRDLIWLQKKMIKIQFTSIFVSYSTTQHSRYTNSLQTGWSGDQILVGTRCFAPVLTRPKAHPASYTMGTGSLLEVKRLRHGIDHPTPSSAEVKERVELYLYSPSGPSWPVRGWTLHLPLQYNINLQYMLRWKWYLLDAQWLWGSH